MKEAGMAEEKREALTKKIQDFDSMHDQWLRRAMFFFGRRLNKMNTPWGRFFVKHISTKCIAWLIVRFKLFGVERKKKKMSAEEIAYEWLKPSVFMRCPTEIGEVRKNRVVIYRTECTVGFHCPEQSKICRASMQMDIEIVRRLGGKLTVTETILEGAQKCKHILETRGKP